MIIVLNILSRIVAL